MGRSQRRKRIWWPYLVTGVIVTALIVAVVVVWSVSKVNTIYVDGNIHYSDEEIADIVTEGTLGNNTIYLFLKYRDREIKDIPFVETMSVSIESADTIRISVYEKSLAGYVAYMDRFLYFDKDGYVVESSTMRTQGIPQVTGLKFDHVVMDEKLPVEREDIFEKVLSMTQLLNKYELSADKLHFDSNYAVSLYFGGVRVVLGTEDLIDEKIMALPDILVKLEGKEGTLNLSDYKKGDMITFAEAGSKSEEVLEEERIQAEEERMHSDEMVSSSDDGSVDLEENLGEEGTEQSGDNLEETQDDSSGNE